MLLDGQDVALVRATIVDVAGRVVQNANHKITFEIVSGPGRIVGTNNGDPQNHDENHAVSRPAYHGLLRAVVMSTTHAAGPAWARDRVREIDIETGVRTTVLGSTPHGTPHAADAQAATPIVVRATADGLTPGTVTINTSTDPDTDGVLAVAAAMAGKPVVFD